MIWTPIIIVLIALVVVVVVLCVLYKIGTDVDKTKRYAFLTTICRWYNMELVDCIGRDQKTDLWVLNQIQVALGLVPKSTVDDALMDAMVKFNKEASDKEREYMASIFEMTYLDDEEPLEEDE